MGWNWVPVLTLTHVVLALRCHFGGIFDFCHTKKVGWVKFYVCLPSNVNRFCGSQKDFSAFGGYSIGAAPNRGMHHLLF
jgi:hypothetical protein